MRKTLGIISTILLFAAIFFILRYAFPIYAGFVPLLLVLFVLDGYLWYSVRELILTRKPVLRHTLLLLYWSPPLLIVCCIFVGIFMPFKEWNIAFRTLVPGIIYVIYVCKLIPEIFLMLNDLFRLFRYGAAAFILGGGVKFRDFHRTQWIQLSGWILGIILFFTMILGIIKWNYDFRVKEQVIHVPELPASFDGMKIVQVSDIHLGSWSSAKELQKAVDIVASLHPDVIFFTGDIANYSTLDVLPFEHILAGMKAGSGIFAILGNHDYGMYTTWPSDEAREVNQRELYAVFHQLGWRLLLNEHAILWKGNDSIAILGVHNWGKAYRFQKLGSIPRAQAGVENMAVQLLLSHDPSFWDSIICHQYRNIDITFSGHTHGFQLGIEWGNIRWSPAQYLYRQWAGLYEMPVPGSHPQYLYVNRGLGSIVYPGRIGILPEITLITLRR